MTTLVGLIAKKEKPAVVLASDLTGTAESWEQRGDFAVRRQRQSESKKIHVSNDRKLAVCMTGVRDLSYGDFLHSLLEGEINFEEAVKRGEIRELLDLNLSRFGGKLWSPELQNSLLVATRYENGPKLYTCWPLGRIEERISTAIGSGSEHALNYLGNQEIDTYRKIGVVDAIKYAEGALDAASSDPYTKGLDLVVITEKGIDEHGIKIKDSVARARESAMREIVSSYQD